MTSQLPIRRNRLLTAGILQLLLMLPAQPAHSAMPIPPLPPCPSSPNCVSSDAPITDNHHVAAYQLLITPDTAWRLLREVLAELPRTTITTQSDVQLRAEVKSPLFGFVDDLEFQLRPDDKTIAVRSASRLGYWDLGVNRRRVEHLRDALRERGVTP